LIPARPGVETIIFKYRLIFSLSFAAGNVAFGHDDIRAIENHLIDDRIGVISEKGLGLPQTATLSKA